MRLKLSEPLLSGDCQAQPVDQQSVVNKKTYLDTRERAMRLLVRREHAKTELIRKLLQRDCDPTVVTQVIENLAAEGLQSDRRYAECYVRSRVGRGYGPLRIRADLASRNIDADNIESGIAAESPCWAEVAAAAVAKKFRSIADLSQNSMGGDRNTRAKIMRFLYTRGFDSHQSALAFELLLADD